MKATFANRTDKPRADKYAKQRELRERNKNVRLIWKPRFLEENNNGQIVTN